MFQKGLVSVTFRSLSPSEIIALCRENHLTSIEWGGDIHVPHGDITTAQTVKKLTVDAGLTIAAYGSYYRAGTYGDTYMAEFQKVLDSASALSAPVIRIWGYDKGSAEVDSETWRRIVLEVQTLCDLAAEKAINISFECHNNTLTDDYTFSVKLMEDIGRTNISMYWQPNQFRSIDYNLASIKTLAHYITNVHVFNWSGMEKYPLLDSVTLWKRYLEPLAKSGKSHGLLLEFMPDGRAESLVAEANALQEICN